LPEFQLLKLPSLSRRHRMILKSLLMAGQAARVPAAQAAIPVAPATLLLEFPLSEVSCLHVRIEAKQTVLFRQ